MLRTLDAILTFPFFAAGFIYESCAMGFRAGQFVYQLWLKRKH